jgi:hypothetical protein
MLLPQPTGRCYGCTTANACSAMRSYRFDVIFDCGDGIGVMPVIATDENAAWLAARSEFPGCKLALVQREEEE